jgi:hypothetical protein
MAGDYWARHFARQRKILGLVIEEIHPERIVDEEYSAALARLNRADAQSERNWRTPIRTFGTCLECLGHGEVENPKWIDGETPNESEAMDCETCRGRGIVEIIDKPDPVSTIDDDFPF